MSTSPLRLGASSRASNSLMLLTMSCETYLSPVDENGVPPMPCTSLRRWRRRIASVAAHCRKEDLVVQAAGAAANTVPTAGGPDHTVYKG